MEQNLEPAEPVITKEIATKGYNDNWVMEDPTLKEVFDRITVLSQIGGSEICVSHDSKKKLNAIITGLREAGFSPEYHNGEPDIIVIEWGV